MTTNGAPLYSNLAIPPGETLEEELEFRDFPPGEPAQSLGLSEETLMKISPVSGLLRRTSPPGYKMSCGLLPNFGSIWKLTTGIPSRT